MSLRIALLSWESKHSIAVGGLAEHVSELSVALARRGHDVHLFTRLDTGQSPYERIDGVHYHRCAFDPHTEFLTYIDRMCNAFVRRMEQVERYERFRFDLVHGHDWLCTAALAHARSAGRERLVLTVHSTEYGRCGNRLFEGPSRRIRELEWEGTYVVNRVVCVSNALRSEVQHLYSVPGDKLHTIYNGVDVRRFDEDVDTDSVRQRYEIDAGDPMVLFAGRMTWQKGPDLLVEAMPGLLRQHPRAKFVFAGEGDMRHGLEERVSRMGVRRAARFVGHRRGRELVDLFKSADLVCVPSRNEPFGIVILEAWSARKPVVATRNGGPAEFVRDQHTGLTVSDDSASIEGGVQALLENTRRARRMADNGRREAEQNFTWDRVAAETEALYDSLSGDGSGGAGDGGWSCEVADMAQQQSGRNTSGNTRSASSTNPTRTAVSRRATAPRTRTVSDVTGVPEPSQDEIRVRAHQIWLERGCAPGDPVADWLAAERELRERYASAPATGRNVRTNKKA